MCKFSVPATSGMNDPHVPPIFSRAGTPTNYGHLRTLVETIVCRTVCQVLGPGWTEMEQTWLVLKGLVVWSRKQGHPCSDGSLTGQAGDAGAS